ncbi:MAG: 2-oxoacid:ferredoxin oxidoreductase subunit beta [Bacteroidales bacterium]|jgi:2-oxoglutarate ferredoxin oxidoreductase subunit beta|nr:2-oxoacid:ferredoxin oxidoreductase subunit beta [Bacteroidales bacterium]
MSYETIERSRVALTKDDFASDQMVKWCPGCGSHAILAALENVFPKIGYRKENFCLVSGIGCASRFPYYVNTYGFHGIHGRANPIATGITVSNSQLSVWVISGDGDSMAIGGNHFIHAIRRNIDLNILLFNNQIYGLTKGQYSPTTPFGNKTKTSPQGTIEEPFVPGELVLGAQGTFFARVVDNNLKLMQEVMLEAAKHNGTSVVEFLQNCVIFNDGAHTTITNRDTAAEHQLILRNGEPMIFGKNRDKGIILGERGLEVVKIGENGIREDDILIHDMYQQDSGLHLMLAKMHLPQYPIALGVIRSTVAPTYDQLLEKQVKEAQQSAKIRNVDDLLNSGDTWEI